MEKILKPLYKALRGGEWHLMGEVLQSMPETLNVNSRAFTEAVRNGKTAGRLDLKLDWENGLNPTARKVYIRSNI